VLAAGRAGALTREDLEIISVVGMLAVLLVFWTLEIDSFFAQRTVRLAQSGLLNAIALRKGQFISSISSSSRLFHRSKREGG